LILLRGSAASWSRLSTPTALAVGVFDGLHSGHRAVLAALRQRAAAQGVVPGVVTFDPHPLAVVAPERAPAMLTDIDQRVGLLVAQGVELIAVVEFDAATRNWTPERFAVGLLAETLAARVVIAGEDFRFGRDRSGDVAGLRALGAEHGFETVVVPLVGGDRPASSSALRALVAAGEVAAVAAELERPHEIRGRVRRGETGLVAEVPAAAALPAPGRYAAMVGRTADEAIAAEITISDAVGIRLRAPDPGLGGSEVRLRFLERVPPTDDAIRTASVPRPP
jgi:riboflavin kinase/FMN adenylyltransferase